MGRVTLAVLATLAAPLAGQSRSGEPPRNPNAESETTVYEGVSVLDGTGAPLRAAMSIVVRDGRIAALAPASEVSLDDWPDAEVEDARGLYVIPGLIESHTHLARIAAEARRQGIPVWSHTHVGPALPMDVARAGVTTMSHVCSLASAAIPEDVVAEARAGRRTGMVDVDLADSRIDAVLEEMRRQGTVLDATLKVGFFRAEMMAARDSAATPPRPAQRPDVPAPDPRRRGVRARCSPEEGVELTRHGALALGLDDEIGTVEEGKYANLVFLERDPTENVDNLQSIRFTLKRGHRFDRDAFDLGTPPRRQP